MAFTTFFFIAVHFSGNLERLMGSIDSIANGSEKQALSEEQRTKVILVDNMSSAVFLSDTVKKAGTNYSVSVVIIT